MFNRHSMLSSDPVMMDPVANRPLRMEGLQSSFMARAYHPILSL
jgi:hypothetical protein